MKKGKILLTLAAIGCAVLVTSVAWADEQICRGKMGPRVVDNLRVPDFRMCTLNGTRVKGTIKVESHATLNARKIIVIGNVQAENAKQVRVLEGSRIGGSVQIKQGGGAAVSDSRVDGDIQYDKNSAPLQVLRNRVGGNVQVVSNIGRILIQRNVVDGNLQCKQNSPRPIGGGNIVKGSKENQCARL